MHRSILLLLLSVSLAANAQVQVSREPRHHKVLENEYVRVLDVHIPPHDTTLMHKHSTPSVFLILSNTKTGSQVLVEPGKTSFADGNIWFESFEDTPRIHRVWNEDTVEFHVMDIELPHTPSTSTFTAPAAIPYGKQLFDTRSVRAFRITLPSGMFIDLPAAHPPLLVISLSGPRGMGLVNSKSLRKKGDFLFISPGTQVEVTNYKSTDEQQFALLYLK